MIFSMILAVSISSYSVIKRSFAVIGFVGVDGVWLLMPTAQIESVLQRVGLHDTKYKKYSLGMKQRLGIAAAVFEQPDIILLDEPTNALDESGITMLENVIQDETSRGATIVMASHDMNFLHHCCSKIYTMRAGTLSL